MSDQHHEWERKAIILLGGGLAYIVTIAIIVLAFQASNEGERNLVIGGLLSSPVFGAAALFALLGIASRQNAGTTVNAGERGTVNIGEEPAATPAVVAVAPAAPGAPAVGTLPLGANVGPVASTPVQSTSRGLQGQHVDRGPVPTFQPHNAEGGTDQRGAPGA